MLTFVNNLAHQTLNPGGILITESNFEMHGNCAFIENTTPSVLVHMGSANFFGVSSFTGHSSLITLGAITAIESTLLFRGNTTFANNSVPFAAAVAAFFCDVRFSGINIFHNNSGGFTADKTFDGFLCQLRYLSLEI